MNKLEFRLKDFLRDKRVTTAELAKLLGVSGPGVVKMVYRGSIKLSVLRKLESHFGDCSKYLQPEEQTTESVIHQQLQPSLKTGQL